MAPGHSSKLKDVLQIRCKDERTRTSTVPMPDGTWMTMMTVKHRRKKQVPRGLLGASSDLTRNGLEMIARPTENPGAREEAPVSLSSGRLCVPVVDALRE
jgi:hypothetical protein